MMDIEIALSIARATERAGKHGEEETVLQVLADEVMDLRKDVARYHFLRERCRCGSRPTRKQRKGLLSLAGLFSGMTVTALCIICQQKLMEFVIAVVVPNAELTGSLSSPC